MNHHAHAFCQRHGPYDATLPRCPYCQREAERAAKYGIAPAATRNNKREQPEVVDVPTHDQTSFEPRETSLDAQPVAAPVTLPASSAEGHVPGSDDDADAGLSDATVLDIPPVTEPLAFLIVIDPLNARGTVYTLRANQTVGRKNANVIIPGDKKISRQHVLFEFHAYVGEDTAGHFTVQDLNTVNGTFLNGVQIDTEVPLHENDELRIGHTTFVIKMLT